jgi:hypothetical protein
MACRYHKLPSELMALELNDFNLNSIILLKAVEKQQEESNKQRNNKWSDIKMHKGKKALSNFNLGIKTTKKGTE